MLRRNLAETSSPDYTTTLTSDVIPLTRNGETFLRRDPGAMTLNASGYTPGAGEIVTFKLILVCTGASVPSLPFSWIWDGDNAPEFVNPGIYVISVTQPQEAVDGTTWLASLDQFYPYSEQMLGQIEYRRMTGAGTPVASGLRLALDEEYRAYDVDLNDSRFDGETEFVFTVMPPSGTDGDNYQKRGFIAEVTFYTTGTDDISLTFHSDIKNLDFEGLWRKIVPGKKCVVQFFSFDAGQTIFASLCGEFQ